MQPEPAFWIRDIPVYGDTMLAPMAGFSDVPHRALCRQFGAGLSYTEFVAAEEIINRTERADQLLDFVPEDRPMVFQIFGNDAQKILQAAQIIEEKDPQIIDVNMGCSTRRVSGRGAGVGMMRQPQLVAETFSLLCRRLSVPITGKIRLGWEDQVNYLEIGRILEDYGAALIAIHPRTKEQKYGGRARWEAIAELKATVNVPVIGNGDIWAWEDIERMKQATKCDGVMIGRGAIGNPWIFSQVKKDGLTFSRVIDTIRRHLATMCDYYGESGLVLFRKYVKRYLEGLSALAHYTQRLVRAESLDSFQEVLLEAEEVFGKHCVSELRASSSQNITRALNGRQSTIYGRRTSQ